MYNTEDLNAISAKAAHKRMKSTYCRRISRIQHLNNIKGLHDMQRAQRSRHRLEMFRVDGKYCSRRC